MSVLRVVVLVASLVSVRGEMCSSLVTVAPGDEGKLLSAKAFAEFTAKCRKERSKVTTKQPLVTTTLPSTTTSVPPSTTEIPSTTTELPSTATTAFTTPLTECFTLQTQTNNILRIPESRDFTSYPVVLLFTLENSVSNLIELRFNDGGSEKYTIQVKRGSTASNIEGEVETVFNHEFDESILFRMTYLNGEITLGVDGASSPMTYKDPDSSTNDVKFIELYSKTKTPTTWKFYRTCNPTFV